MLHPSLFPRVHVSQLAPFSGDGRVYWAFDHLIAARHGTVLLVPMWVMHGLLDGAVHGCPVPWDEVFDVLHTPRLKTQAAKVAGSPAPMVAALGDFAPEMWMVDSIITGGGVATRFSHVSGITFAAAPELTGLSTTQAVSGDVTAADDEDSSLPGIAKKSAGGVTYPTD